MAEATPTKANSDDAPLHTLSRDQLSVLLYYCFTDPELTELMKAQKISIPGYRPDRLSGVQKADAIADEIRAYPKAREPVLKLLRELYEYPALDVVALTPEVASELAWLATQEDTAMRLLWRVLSDGEEKIRAQALPALDELVKRFYAPPAKGGEGAPAAPPQPERKPKPAAGADAAALQKLEREAKEARLAAEQANKKSEELKAQLKEVRAAEAHLGKDEAKARKQLEKLTAELAKLKPQLQEARKKGGKAELEKAHKQLESLEARAAALEEQKARLTEERDALQAQLAEAGKKSAAEAPKAAESEEPEEAPREWLLPRFTPEFYDSLEGWDLRLQRAAFKQANLLAENHRHPSLQALPLQGAPGFYRVRVATDVRLIYRRVDEHHVDILSLIDREDLDRYVRQAKTR